MAEETREPQYKICSELRDAEGFARFGLMSNQTWHDDPMRLLFMLSRYKFVAKMFAGRRHVLEIGCADAFGTRFVRQAAARVTAADFDPVFIRDAAARKDDSGWDVECITHDILDGPVAGGFDAAFSLDVLEHIAPENETAFVSNIVRSVEKNAPVIIGTPSLQSQQYASPPSREGHINCKDSKSLLALLETYFYNVFIFSMNDEVVHTGFYPMAHYWIALCCGIKE